MEQLSRADKLRCFDTNTELFRRAVSGAAAKRRRSTVLRTLFNAQAKVSTPEDVLGWRVFTSLQKKYVGTIEDVINSADLKISPALVKVVNDQPEGAAFRPGVAEKHVIPFVKPIFTYLDTQNNVAFITPPKGLLQLGRQQLLLDLITPRVLEIATASLDNNSKRRIASMPTRSDLEKMGEHRLVKGILGAGGFLTVAQKLNLRSARKPVGFWESIDILDEELSLLVAAHWVELEEPDDQQVYFYNQITRRTQWVVPEMPTKILLDDEGTVLLAEDERERVMPPRSAVLAAGRYDLHHAIMSHGGYRAVTEALERIPSWPRNRFSSNLGLVIRELKAVQRQIAGQGNFIPSANILLDLGRSDLRDAVMKHGGFHKVAGLAGFQTSRRPRGYWSKMETVVREVKDFVSSRGSDATCSKSSAFPTATELLAAGRGDILGGIKLQGREMVAKEAGLQLLPLDAKGRQQYRRKSKRKEV